MPAWHGPGGSHGYDAQLDEAQTDAIHNLLEWIEHNHPQVQEVVAFYDAFRGA